MVLSIVAFMNTPSCVNKLTRHHARQLNGFFCRRGIAVRAILLACLSTLCACANYKYQDIGNHSFKQRAMLQSQGPIMVKAAVPDARETEELTGIDLYDQNIQPVWLEVSNQGDHPVRVALWSIDSDYYAPNEVAYMNRGGLSNKGEASLQRWFHDHRMVRVIAPGETRSGFVYTHLGIGTKGFNLDTYSNAKLYSFTYFIPMPGFIADYMEVEFEDLYADEEFHLVDSGDVDGFYAILRQSTVCCSKNASGQQGDPINLVMVGSGLAIRRALLRAGWNETAANDPETTRSRSHLYRGRRPDGTFHQYRPDGSERKELRLWLAPGRVGEDYVWLAQTSYDVTGVKKDFSDYRIDPDIDSARRFATQSFWYSQSVASIGVVRSDTASSPEQPQSNFHGDEYFSDGLRTVLWLSETPIALDKTAIEDMIDLLPSPNQDVSNDQ
jgi:hypothetical protein